MTFDNFADILVMSRVIAPEAISDPDNYDDNARKRAGGVPPADDTDRRLAEDWTVVSPEAGG